MIALGIIICIVKFHNLLRVNGMLLNIKHNYLETV